MRVDGNVAFRGRLWGKRSRRRSGRHGECRVERETRNVQVVIAQRLTAQHHLHLGGVEGAVACLDTSIEKLISRLT